MNADRKNNKAAKRTACPICDKPVEQNAEHFPFCSNRCRLVDLGKWFGGTYKMSRPLNERDLDEES